MLCSSCGRGLPDGGLTCGACGGPVIRSGGTGVPAPPLSPYRTTGAGRRRRLALLGATVALLTVGVVGVVGVSALTGSGSDAGTSSGATGVDTYESGDAYDTEPYDDAETYGPSDGVGTASAPSVPDDTDWSSGSGGYVVLPHADAWANRVEDAFNAYFEGINNGDAQLAWMQLSSSSQQQTPLDEFADAVRTTHDSGFVVQEASYTGGRAHVWLEFTSTQDPELGPNPGEGCTMWSLDYVLVEHADGTFRIDEVAGHGGTTGHSPC